MCGKPEAVQQQIFSLSLVTGRRKWLGTVPSGWRAYEVVDLPSKNDAVGALILARRFPYSNGNPVAVFYVERGKKPRPAFHLPTDTIATLARGTFSPSGDMIACIVNESDGDEEAYAYSIRIYDLRDRSDKPRITVELTWQPWCTWDGTGHYVVVAPTISPFEGGAICRVVDVLSGKVRECGPVWPPTDPPQSLQVAWPKGNKFPLLADWRGLWRMDVASGGATQIWEWPHLGTRN